MPPQGSQTVGGAERPIEPLPTPPDDALPLSRHDLPPRQTSFVGRAMELAELRQLLTAPNCRLVTIIGPGGMGKTRLAVEAAEGVRERFPDGIAFVSLQAVSAAEPIAPVLAVAIGCILTGKGDAREQIARFLRPLRMLLVIDSVEHLLDETSWLGELLAEAPEIRMLVTSRQALNLREEWRYPLAGLAVPGDSNDDPGQFEAVRLFVERAQQVRPDFAFEVERDGVIRLCSTVEGMPLALELAAPWVSTLSCADIAAEIERTIAFLATDMRNVPARHRSMKATFDHSWALLAEDERLVFQRLAVFRGGFSRDAAELVARATLPRLSSLVDKSLVRRRTDGRFHLHELLREYADERLGETPEEEAAARAAHREFYLAFATAHLDAITGGAQRKAIGEIGAELDNIRAAWRDAVTAGDVAALGRVAHVLALFFDFRARYQEGYALLDEALRVLRAAPPSRSVDRAIAAVLVDLVRMNHRLTRLSAMRAMLEEAEAAYAALGEPPPPGHLTDPLSWRALVMLIDGRYAEAADASAEAVARNMANDRPGNLPFAWWLRAAAALWQEDIDAAESHARQSTETARALGDHWLMAYGHNVQGHVAAARGDFTVARQHYGACFVLREELDDPEGMGTALGHIAKVALLQGELEEAAQLHQRSLDLGRRVGDQLSIAQALNGLGLIACARNDYAAAGRDLAEGLRLMAEARFLRNLLVILASAGEWLLRTGQPDIAVSTLSLTEAHPASDLDTRTRARKLLAEVAGMIAPDEYAATVEGVRGTDPVDLAMRLIPLLTAPVDRRGPASPAVSSPATAAVSALVEPLTGRELAVLQQIAAGRSNREIADELFLSVNTVRSYSQQLYGKLGVGSRTQAIARARELGILD